jgi:hypothetical protein
MFDEANRTAVDEALALRKRFVAFVNSSMEVCTFSHSNAAAWQDRICSFPFDNDPKELPHRSPVFNAADYAFFIPKAHNLVANEWWRRNRAPSIHYINHVNTGCQDNDHTIFAQFDYQYGRSVNTTAFYCCHDGPPGCTCDNVQYKLLGTDTCLAIDARNKLTLSPCAGSSFNLGSWRETVYVPNPGEQHFRQLENYGNRHYGNTYRCLTLTNCKVGSILEIGDCRYTDKPRTQFGWESLGEGAEGAENANTGGIVADSCGSAGLCLGVRPGDAAAFVLADCGSNTSSWVRQRLED